MSVQELLSRLLQMDIKLWVEGDRLRYNAPKGAMTSELQTELSNRKTELVAYLQRSGEQAQQSIIPVARPEYIPLSFAQQRLWFLDQLTPGSAAYNMFSALRLRGPLDVAALGYAFERVVQRHESLRTTFHALDGEPYQSIAPHLTIPLPLSDLCDAPWEEVERVMRAEAAQSFDLASGPLVRGSLLRLADSEHILLLTMHHIISDGWSLGVLSREIVQLGQAYAVGQHSSPYSGDDTPRQIPDPLPALPLQYADFSIWQRSWLSGRVLAEQMEFWKRQIKSAATVLDLPTDHPRPLVQTYKGARLHRTLPPQLTADLLELTRREDGTLFMTLLAAFQALLSRYSGQTDVLVGSPIANRNRSELENLIGFFANTLVLRADFSANPSFPQLLRQVRETCLNAYDHQDVQFEKLVDELHIPRDLGRNPIFQVMFILQNLPNAETEFAGLHIQPIEIEPDTSQFDLRLSLQETPEGLDGFIEYSTDLFDKETITLLFDAYEHILASWTQNPGLRVSELELPPDLAAKAHLPRAHSASAAVARPEGAQPYVAPRTPVEEVLVDAWQQVLNVQQVGIHDNFFALGGDSLLGIRVIAKARRAGVNLRPIQLFQCQTIAKLAEVADASPAIMGAQDVVSGPVPLAPNQQWFFDQNFAEQHRFNFAPLFEVDESFRLDPALIKQVLGKLMLHHDILRMYFIKDEAGWHGVIAPPSDDVPFRVVDLSALPYPEQAKAIKEIGIEEQNNLDLLKGPLIKVILFQLGNNRSGRLFFIIHHLVTDGFSNSVLMEDLFTAYRQLSQGEKVNLPTKTTSFKEWTEKLVEYARSPQILDELEIWQAKPDQPLPDTVPSDYPGASYLWGTSFLAQGGLNVEETQALTGLLKQHDMQIIELMLAAMAETLATAKSDRSMYVDILMQGRSLPLDGVDLSRTVAWTVLHYPLLLRLEGTSNLLEALPLVKEQFRRPLYGGVGYDLLRYMNGDEQIKRSLLPRPTLTFTHDSVQPQRVEPLIRPASEFVGFTSSTEIIWPYTLELRTWLAGDQLNWQWVSGESIFKRSTLEKLSLGFGDILRKLIS